jgi:predicted anti-sigma-YlaC factor YlaD
MTDIKVRTGAHPAETELAGFLAGRGTKDDRQRIEEHLSSCSQCLGKVVAAYEAVAAFNGKTPNNKKKDSIMKKLNI